MAPWSFHGTEAEVYKLKWAMEPPWMQMQMWRDYSWVWCLLNITTDIPTRGHYSYTSYCKYHPGWNSLGIYHTANTNVQRTCSMHNQYVVFVCLQNVVIEKFFYNIDCTPYSEHTSIAQNLVTYVWWEREACNSKQQSHCLCLVPCYTHHIIRNPPEGCDL